MDPGELARIADQDLGLSILDGNGLNLNGVEPVVLERPVVRKDESAHPFPIRDPKYDLTPCVLEEELVVTGGQTGNQEVSSSEGDGSRMIGGIERLFLGKKREDGRFVLPARLPGNGYLDHLVRGGVDDRGLNVASRSIAINGPLVARPVGVAYPYPLDSGHGPQSDAPIPVGF